MCKHSTVYGQNPKIPAPQDRPVCSVDHCDQPRAIISCLKDGSPNYRKVCSSHHSRNVAAKHGLTYMGQVTAKKRGISMKQYNREKLQIAARNLGMTIRQYNRYKLETSARNLGMTTRQYQQHIKLQTALNAGFDSVTGYQEHQAKQAGFDSYTDYKNSKHPYLKYRKDYCENTDSRLGFKCTTNVFWQGMLDVDHKNGIPNDNRPENLQTLCKCCHAYKSNINKDYASIGRKAIKALILPLAA